MNPINSHINASLAAARIHRANSTAHADSLQKLASGQRINRAADDPAGLITSENLRAVLASLDAEARSLQRADHVANTADGVLQEVSQFVGRAEELIIANTNTAAMNEAERQANQMELNSIVGSINRIAGLAQFNGRELFDGTMTLIGGGESITFDAIDAANLGRVEVDGQTYSMADLGSGRPLNIVTGDLAEALETARAAREQVNSLRGRIGSFQKDIIRSRLNDLSVTIENIASAESQIRDTDYARETANLSRLALLHDSSIRNLGLINSRAKNVLNLLG
jgi:flagellin